MIVRIIIGRSRTEKTETLAKEPMDLAKFNGNIFERRRLVKNQGTKATKVWL